MPITWHEPFELRHDQGLTTKKPVVQALNRQLTNAVKELGVPDAYWTRCVYIIRMKGDFIVAYPWHASPVLYIGRGFALGRLATHLSRWLNEVDKFGREVTIEIRICRPRRQKLAEFYKYVEAFLIASFAARHGSIPFFNSRREPKYQDCEHLFSENEKKELRAAIGIGRGKRPRWAIAPMPANKNYDVYNKGHEDW